MVVGKPHLLYNIPMVWCSGSPIRHTLTYHTILIVVDGGLVAPYQSIPVSQLVGQWPEGIPPTRNILHILIP